MPEESHKYRIILHGMPEGQNCIPCNESERIIKEAMADHDIEFKKVVPKTADEAIAPTAPVILIQTNCSGKRIEGGVTSRDDLEKLLKEVSCDAVRKELWGLAQKKVEQLEQEKLTECEMPPK